MFSIEIVMSKTQVEVSKLDKFDRQILEIVQVSNRVTADHIAEKIGLSKPAVQRRLNKLRTDNVITNDVSIVNPSAMGRHVMLHVLVTLERERLDLFDAFKQQMKRHTMVQQCYYVTGTTDFILVVTAKDMEDYERFTQAIFFKNSNVKHFVTNVVMDVVKSGLAIPVL